MQKDLTIKVNIWSLEILIYQLLGNVPPFVDKPVDQFTPIKINLIKGQIVKSESGFSYKQWEGKSQFIDLIKKCLVKYPALRPQINEIMKIEWVNLGQLHYFDEVRETANKNNENTDNAGKR